MSRHEQAVERIAASVKKFHTQWQPFRINHGSTNSTRQGYHDRTATIDISDLSEILSVNAETRSALVEPNVPMDKLVEATLEYGLIPPVVMEFPGITAGGGYAGTGAESSSFKHGYFNETVKRVEMVIGNGDTINATSQEHADLFYGASGAVGSLGITTLLEIKLVQASKYVRATYQRVGSISEATMVIERNSTDLNLDYLDGMLYSPNHGAIVTGNMTDERPSDGHIQTFSNPKDPWFYLHVKEKTLSPGCLVTEYIPLADYLFRYDRGGFWVGESAFKYFRFPFNSFTRWWLDDFLHTRMLYEALHGSNNAGNYIVQDLAIPFDKANAFINYTTKSFDIWPLWLCPLRQPRIPTLHPHSQGKSGVTEDSNMLLNVGLWGYGPSTYDAYVAKNRELELKLPEFGGMKWLYAQTYYGESEFWKIFDRDWYDALREKYMATSLPDVWSKVTVDPLAQKETIKTSWGIWALQFWPFGGIWGLVKSLQSQKYLLARTSRWNRTRNPRQVEDKSR